MLMLIRFPPVLVWPGTVRSGEGGKAAQKLVLVCKATEAIVADPWRKKMEEVEHIVAKRRVRCMCSD